MSAALDYRQAPAPSDSPLRIVHLVRSPVGGIFRHIADLATAQAAAGHQVGFVCDSLTGGAFEAERITALEPHLALGAFRLPIARQIAPSDVTALARVHRRLAPLAPDVVHSHGAKGGVFGRVTGAWLNRAKPVARIYAPHGGSLHFDPATAEGRIYFAIERALETVSDVLVHVSEYERRAYVDKVGAPRCQAVVVRNGLTPPEFEAVAPAPDASDFLYLGMLRDLKGPDVFIEALALLARDGAAATGTIVGDGPDEARYRGLVAERGLAAHVRFLPPRPAREAFATARAIVVPSRAESMPYVVLEAIAAGLPILATDVGGIPEIFGPFSGDLLPPGDAAALAAAMGRLMADAGRARGMARERRAHIAGEFALSSMASRIETVYRDAIAARETRTFSVR
ncbi:glycosyltransferase family 4 protein [Methylopila sp. 73B]|uniref:glycosyltransferase family 4 protein n=1 Tax=Methylopila sp. 73B TaxID=1120792 RepID=UPI00039FECDE|nr:glycosyltransferase family 4 protein [Methylopila sp. 73B]